MARREVLGLFRDAETAAGATTVLHEAGVRQDDIEVLTGAPYPEGAFGEHIKRHRIYLFPMIGAICGFTVAILLTAGTQLAYPVVTGGKPILSVPPMVIITYEGTLLGAILFTVLGVVFESRLPRGKIGLYDPRITEGFIGLVVSCAADQWLAVEQALRRAGAFEVKHEQA
ncbi:MAG: DUF3341 domain-containing protein [Chloroflexi bacterium]|nr:DUF3341 domain-containing protein [Chloroflexota bacterium]